MATAIQTGSSEFTLGGLVVVNDEVLGLTVAHPFERSDGSIMLRPGVRKIGSLREKEDLWAVCTLDYQSNTLKDRIVNPKRIREEVQDGAAVLVHTTTKAVTGIILDYSLIAPPGLKKFYRMWMVVLDNPLSSNDAGSWVVDAVDEDLYGHVVLKKDGTLNTFYVARAQDISSSIHNKFAASEVLFYS